MTTLPLNARVLPVLCGMCALVIGLMLGGEAHAGLMLSTDSAAAESVTFDGAGAAIGDDQPHDGISDSERQHMLEALLSQHADGGAGGAGTSVIGFNAAIMLPTPARPIAEKLVGIYFDLENSILPVSPAFDLLKPPQMRV
jgi:hypothetical protein